MKVEGIGVKKTSSVKFSANFIQVLYKDYIKTIKLNHKRSSEMNYNEEKKRYLSFCGSYCHTCNWFTGK